MPLEYGFRTGMDLIYSATLDLIIQGDYSEQSTRVIETRFVVNRADAGGRATVLGLSRLVHRILEGQEVEAPFGNFQAYQFTIDPPLGLFKYESDPAEYGTGWTPMLYFPPLPNAIDPGAENAQTTLPLYTGVETSAKGNFNVFIRRETSSPFERRISATLIEPVSLQADPAITLLYQEHEILFDLRKKLPNFSRTSSQMQMTAGQKSFVVELNVESRLVQANIFEEKNIPVMQQEVQKFFESKRQLGELDVSQADRVVQLLIEYSEKTPLPLLREAVKDLVLKHRYDQRLAENRSQTEVGLTAPPLQVRTLNGEMLSPDAKPKAMVLLFWALWWEPAEQALLDLQTICNDLQPKNVQVIGVNLDTSETAARHYLQLSGIEMLTVWDEGHPKTGIAFQYGVKSIPTNVVIDKKGKIIARDLDPLQLKNMIKKLD